MRSLSIQTVVPVLTTGSDYENASGRDSAAATTLKQIDWVRIRPAATNSDGYGVYTIAIFHAGTSAAIDSRSTSHFDSGRGSDGVPIRIERNHVDFLALQAQLRQCVHFAHTMIPCAFCRELIDAIGWGGAYVQLSPLAMLALTWSDWTRVLEDCVNELLRLSSARCQSQRRQPCSAQVTLPSLLLAFLFASDAAVSQAR